MNPITTRIQEVQNGSGLDREKFPEYMKGELAKDLWDDDKFSFGMEYGYILALLEFEEFLKK